MTGTAIPIYEEESKQHEVIDLTGDDTIQGQDFNSEGESDDSDYSTSTSSNEDEETMDVNALISELREKCAQAEEEFSESIKEVAYVVADLRERNDRLETLLDEKNQEIENLTTSIEIVRNTMRRLRFNQERHQSQDSAFFASFRRRFCDNYEDSMRMIGEYEPHQLIFLGHLLDLPVARLDAPNNHQQ